MAGPKTTPRRETLNLRIKPEDRRLIDRAATLTGKTLTNFVLEAARHAAEKALLDRTIFTVSPEAYAQFLARLDETRHRTIASNTPRRLSRPGSSPCRCEGHPRQEREASCEGLRTRA